MQKNYAVLIFSRNSERFIPYAYGELIRYTGKIEAFMAAQKARKTVFLTIVSAEGLKKTGYASRVNQVVTLDDLLSY